MLQIILLSLTLNLEYLNSSTYFISIISLDQRIYSAKIFFMPIIITQLIRGAGYFNGGFILAINILIILYIYNIKFIQC